MAKFWILLLGSLLLLSPIRQGALAQFDNGSSTTDDGCSTTPECQQLNSLLSGCGGTWAPPPPGRTTGEYGVDDQNLARCMCTEQYYDQLDLCLKCYQRQSKNIIPAARSVYDSDCDRLGVPGFPGPEKKNSTKIILIAVLASAAVLIIAAAVFWFVYIKYKAKRKRGNTDGGPPQSGSSQPSGGPQSNYHRPSMAQPQEYESVKNYAEQSPQLMPQTMPQTPQTPPPPQGYPASPGVYQQQPPQSYVGYPQPQPQHPQQSPQIQQHQYSMYMPSTPIPTAGTEVIPTPGTSEQSGVQEYYPPPSHPPPSSSPSVPAVYYASSMNVTDRSSAYPPSPGGQPHEGQFPSVLQPGGRPLSDMNREPSPSST